ncbi:GH92 family glycosyl hydrolase [Segetibacter sp. 3557_3]|uniref:GH92 family glycosyl hydrolase n=1 Tax=Segetibacter sp. 3557_3 TaxID=2547429 RepID=UPI001404E8FB|nr:GH92 family glycosyl hydrolase [Segetibacter sp. 3557_3]
MKKILFALPGLLCFITAHAQKLTDKVDVFLGTGGHGHVYPGATVPFGMVQLSPDNGKEGWDWSSGYHYSSDTIAGFSHTHLSGTGIGDWCDISVMPFIRSGTGDVRSSFSHGAESGRPGYYKVKLDNGILCEMTATNRNGFHRYTFPGNDGWLQFDMGFHINWDQPTQGYLQLVNDSTLVGKRYSTGWAKNQRVYFAARFSRPSTAKLTKIEGRDAKMALHFSTESKPLTVRVALSSVGMAEALDALKETANTSFEQVSSKADEAWERELSKIKITSAPDFETKFYTALYRTCLAPVIYSDNDGKYRNQDNLVKKSIGDKYTVFSLWDTFRALHPLFTLTQPERLPAMLNSLLSFYDDNGLLPVWDLSTWETNTMTGYHAIPVLADAILKGVKGFDVEKAYRAMLKSANQKQRGTQEYIRYGYLPQDKHGWSVTITLEYAFDDWCIAQVAKKLGKTSDYQTFSKRSLSYQKLFDSTTGFMRAKDSSGKFISPFDPLLSEHGFEGQYVEGTAWQHSFFVPHDVQGLAKLYGGKERLVAKLDTLFSTTSELHGTNVSGDISGLIGQYAHGNEPSHHIIYMYAALGYPQKAAKQITTVVDSVYKLGPDGLSGNDDCGQMSAWLVWTALGMYPMNPASGEYVFGYPLVDEAMIALPNGKRLSIKVSKASSGEKRIKKVSLNGKTLVTSITHQQLLSGGKMIIDL